MKMAPLGVISHMIMRGQECIDGGEDGLAGISDKHQNLCFCLGLWNGNDAILKERLYGLTGEDGNHGEDVKELYYYLDNTPSHSYMKYLYKYPQSKFPYGRMLRESQNRTKKDREYEVLDTGVFDENKYFDVFVEYAKEGPEDICIKITVCNRANEPAKIVVAPNFWFRNLWDFGVVEQVPSIKHLKVDHPDFGGVKASHHRIGEYNLYFETPDKYLFTDNKTNTERIYNTENESPFVKDLFHHAIIDDKDLSVFDNVESGTKFAPYYNRIVEAHGTHVFRLKLSSNELIDYPFGDDFEEVFEDRIKEADTFYDYFIPKQATEDMANIQRQAFAGMLWTKQYYNLIYNNGWMEIKDNLRLQSREKTAGILNGFICTMKIFYPCPINGNILGMQLGIPLFIVFL